MFTAGCPYNMPIWKHHLVRCFPQKKHTCPIESPVMVDRLLGKSNQITKQKSIALSCYIMLYHAISKSPFIFPGSQWCSPIANEIRPNSSLSLQTWQEARVEGRRGQGSEVHIASADRGGSVVRATCARLLNMLISMFHMPIKYLKYHMNIYIYI